MIKRLILLCALVALFSVGSTADAGEIYRRGTAVDVVSL